MKYENKKTLYSIFLLIRKLTIDLQTEIIEKNDFLIMLF